MEWECGFGFGVFGSGQVAVGWVGFVESFQMDVGQRLLAAEVKETSSCVCVREGGKGVIDVLLISDLIPLDSLEGNHIQS